jgi:isoamylase
MAWGQTECAGLESSIAHTRGYRPFAWIPFLLHLIANAYWEPLEFEVPPLEGQKSWRRCVDTYLDPPNDIRRWEDAQILQGSACRVQPRSVVILLANADFEREADGSP